LVGLLGAFLELLLLQLERYRVMQRAWQVPASLALSHEVKPGMVVR
jgi:hypothetical protein